MQFNFIKYRRIYYIFSAILVIGSLVVLVMFGLKLGIDFIGGTIMEVDFQGTRPENQIIREKIKDLNLGEITLQPTGENGLILRMKEIDESTHQQLKDKLAEFSPIIEKRFETIGPLIGRELTQKTWQVIILSLLAMLVYIALAFRKVKRPVASWQYGILSIVGLIHNVLIPIGVFAVLGRYYNIEIGIPFVVALLTIVGYSINDTVVVFDRIRENLLKRASESFDEVVNISINQTFGRSVNTVLTVLFTLTAIYFFGGETLKYFALAMIIGIAVGAYASVFICSPLLVSWWRKKQGKIS
jgi:preprotein translocase subunit SecF